MKSKTQPNRRLKALTTFLFTATCLTSAANAGTSAKLDNNGHTLLINSDVKVDSSGTFAGSGTTILAKDNTNNISKAVTLYINDGTSIEAAVPKAFGDGVLTFTGSTTLLIGSMQEGTTNDITSPVIFSNPICLNDSTTQVYINNKGYVVNSQDPTATPSVKKQQAVTLESPIYTKSTDESNVTVVFESGSIPITLNGDLDTVPKDTYTIPNFQVNSYTNLNLDSQHALPTTFHNLTLDDQSNIGFYYDGAVINPTTIIASGSPSLYVDTLTSVTLGGVLTGRLLTKMGNGKLTLTGVNRNGKVIYAGLNISNGTVSVANITNLPPQVTLNGGILALMADLTLTGLALGTGGTLSSSNAITMGQAFPSTENVVTVTLTGGGSFDLNSQNNSVLKKLKLSLDENTTLIAQSAKDLPPTVTLNGGTFFAPKDLTLLTVFQLLANSNFFVAENCTLTLNTDLNSEGSVTMTKTGAGTLALVATTGVDSRQLSVAAGTVLFADPTVLPGNSNNTAIKLDGGTLQYNGKQEATLANPLTLTDNSYLFNNSDNALELSKAITGEYNLDVTCAGYGSYILTADNSSSSTNLIITSGLVQISDETNLPGKTATLHGGGLGIATSLTLTQLLNVTADSYIQFGDGVTLTLEHALPAPHKVRFYGGGVLEFGSDVDNSSSTDDIDVEGATTLSISNLSQFPDAAVILKGGILKITKTMTAPEYFNGVVLQDNSNINVADGTFTLNAPITGAHTVLKEGLGTLALGVQNTAAGQALQIDAGTVQFSNGNQIPGNASPTTTLILNGGALQATDSTTLAQPLNVTTKSTLTIASEKTLTFTGQFSGSKVLNVENGTLDLTSSGDNSSAGTTLAITTGATVVTNNANQLPTATDASLELSGGTWQHDGGNYSYSYPQPVSITGDSTIYTPSGTLTLANSLSGSGKLIKSGNGGVLALAADNTKFTGAVDVTGTLELKDAKALSASNAVTLAVGSYLDLNTASTPTFAMPITIQGDSNLNVVQSAILSGDLSATNDATLFVNASGQTLTLTSATQSTKTCPLNVTGKLIANDTTCLPQGTLTFQPGSVFQINSDANITNTIVIPDEPV